VTQIHISDDEMDALTTTAAMGDFALEDVVVAAAWWFAKQEEDFKEHYIRTTWLLPPSDPVETPPQHGILKEKLHAVAGRFRSIFG
jgi:hypothetical protein